MIRTDSRRTSQLVGLSRAVECVADMRNCISHDRRRVLVKCLIWLQDAYGTTCMELREVNTKSISVSC